MLLGVYAISSARRGYIQRVTQAERLVAETERANAEQAHAATLAERARVAREIHDVLAHSLAALTVQLEVADALITDGRDIARAQSYVTRAQRIAREGLAETRRAIAALRDDSAPLPDLLRALVDAYQAEADAAATLTISGEHRPLGHDVALTLYRTAQEAFTNVRKHAPGAPVTMALAYDRTTSLGGTEVPAVELRITNTASRATPGTLHASGGGYGLTGMRERAELLSGELLAGPVADGWQVVVRLPDGAHVDAEALAGE
jgi:signal transduction histidine kinase